MMLTDKPSNLKSLYIESLPTSSMLINPDFNQMNGKLNEVFLFVFFLMFWLGWIGTCAEEVGRGVCAFETLLLLADEEKEVEEEVEE